MGSDAPQTPPAPAYYQTGNLQETAKQTIDAQINSIPDILKAQQQYGPQFSQTSLDALQQFGPQFAQTALDLQKQYAGQFADVERSLSPELAGAQKTLADFLGSTDQQEYDSMRPGLLEDVRAGQSMRGIGAISPLGSIDESVQLQRLKQSLKDRRLNIALSTAGRVPISGVPQIQGQTGTGQLVQNISPNETFGYQQSLNNFNNSIFSSQAGIYGSQLQQQGSPLGSILGGVAGGLTGGLSTGLGYSFLGNMTGRKS